MKHDYIINVGDCQVNCLPIESARTVEEGIDKATKYIKFGKYAEVVYMPEDNDDINEIIWTSENH